MGTDVSAEIAKEIVSAAESAGSALSSLGDSVRKIENVELRKQILSRIGEMMLDVYGDVMRPMIARYPDLDPDKET